MSDQDVPILTRAPEEKTDEVTEALTELTKQTEFLGRTLDITKPLQKMTEAGTKSMKLMQETFLGDIGFVTSPLKEVGGIFKNMGEGIGSLFGKKKKTPPKRSAMLKTNPEAVFITDTLLKKDKDENFLEKFKGIIPLLLGGGAAAAGLKTLSSKLGPLLMKAGGIGMIVGSLIWMAIDGFVAYGKSGEWGVSKVSAVIGGILAGTGSGWLNAFKGMGKWALMGAGIGLIIGPVGALIGGLIGAALGGIMGFIGGEKIAKGLDAVGNWFVGAWKSVSSFFIKSFGSIINLIKIPFIPMYESILGVIDRVKSVFASDESLPKKVGRLLFELVSFAPRMIVAYYTGMFNSIKSIFLNLFTDQEKPDGTIKKGLVKKYWEILRDVFTMIGTKVKDMFFGMVTGIVTIGTEIKDGIVTAIKAIPQLLINTLNGAFELISGFWAGLEDTLKGIPIVGDVFSFLNDHVFKPIGNIFTSIKDGIINFIEDPIGFGKSIIQDLLDSVREIFTSVKEGFLAFASDPMGYIKDGVGAGLNSLKEGASNLWGKVTGSINDGIVRPDGSIVQTHPDDTIIATKNPVAFADKESNSMVHNINSGNGNSNANLENLIRELIRKQVQPQPNNTMLQNITSRYNPQAVMANLTTEVF